MSLRDIPVIGGFLADLTGEDEAGEQQVKNFQKMQQGYAAQRPINREARMNALRQQMSLFEPMNNFLGQQYGPDARFDFSQVFKSPFYGPEQDKYNEELEKQRKETEYRKSLDMDKFLHDFVFSNDYKKNMQG